MNHALLVVVAWLLSGAALLAAPQVALSRAAADAAHLPTTGHYRYLDLSSIPAKRWPAWVGVLSYHVNSLSRETVVTPPVLLPGGLLRLNLDDYGIDPAVWDRLADKDYVYHVTLQKTIETPLGYWYDAYGRQTADYAVGSVWRQASVGKVTKKVSALAPWLAATPSGWADLALLVKVTHSPAPLLPADFFLWQTAIQQDRAPAGYYDFLGGIKTEKDFQKLIGFDAKVLEKFPLVLADAVAESDVTARRKPRGITRDGKIGGGYWVTWDVNIPKDKADPLRVLDPARNLDVTAKEELGQLPNGLLATFLGNAQGVAQDVAPQTIAFDRFGASRNDFNVHAGTISCARCHTADGFNDVEPYVRGVLNRPPLTVASTDPKVQQRLRRLYADVAALPEALAEDRRGVARAVARATSWDGTQLKTELAGCWDEVNDEVDLARAARELGSTPEAFSLALHKSLAQTGSVDPALAIYFPAEGEVAKLKGRLRALALGRRLHYEVWQETYPLAQLVLYGAVALQPVEIEVPK